MAIIAPNKLEKFVKSGRQTPDSQPKLVPAQVLVPTGCLGVYDGLCVPGHYDRTPPCDFRSGSFTKVPKAPRPANEDWPG